MKRTHTARLSLALFTCASIVAAQEAPAEPPPASEPPASPAPEAPAPPSEPVPPPSEPVPPPSEAAPLAPFPSATSSAPAPPPTASFEPAPPPAAPRPAATPPGAAAVAPAAAPAKQVPADEEKVEKKDDRNGVLGPFRIGPVVGVGLPSLINVGGMLKLTPYFAAGVDIGVAPSVNLPYYGDATVSYNSYEAYVHIHPFGGGLYLGAALGYATASGTAEETVSVDTPAGRVSGTLRSEGSVQTLVLTPELGYFYTFKSGFSLGVGAGLQIPVASSEIEYQQSVDSAFGDLAEQYLDPTRRMVEDSLEKVGQTPLPTVGISIGWLL